MTDGGLVVNPFAAFQQQAQQYLVAAGVPGDRVQLSVPPEPEFGELASNAAFLLAKEWRKSPRDIALELAQATVPASLTLIDHVVAMPNGFVNFYLAYDVFISLAIEGMEAAGSNFGRLESAGSKRVVIEHTSVNPNKEWHVGHLRNVVIGDTLVRAARQAGELVEVQNYIDDTGRQAAEAVLALNLYGPPNDAAGEKFDQQVGRRYVEFNGELETADEERKATLEAQLLAVLHEMEEGKHRAVVERVVRAQLETAARIGASYDLLVWESDIVRAHLLEEALGLLKQSPQVFTPDSGQYQGALVIRLMGKGGAGADDPDAQLRVLVRSNGLPTYTGKDIPYMMWKFGLLSQRLGVCAFPSPVGEIRTSCPNGEPFQPEPPSEVINVVAEHQALQQQTVIEGLAAAGYAEQAGRAHHLSYGMVSQAGGKISGRKGMGSSGDDVLNEAAMVAAARIAEKRHDISEMERQRTAEAIAVGSIRFMLVQYSPVKPIVFDLEDVVSFEGGTGLYLQYAMVRMGSILNRAEAEGTDSKMIGSGNLSLLSDPSERALVLRLSKFPLALEDVLRTRNVNIAAEFALSVASQFSQFYRDCPIIQAEPELRLARLRLLAVTRQVLMSAAEVLGIPVVERL